METIVGIMDIVLHPADIQDRDGAPEVILKMLATAPSITRLWTDGGYRGPKFPSKLAAMGVSPELAIVLKPKDRVGFQVLFRR